MKTSGAATSGKASRGMLMYDSSPPMVSKAMMSLTVLSFFRASVERLNCLYIFFAFFMIVDEYGFENIP